ncbi:hypothetical protein J6590_003907 [Homalodisca vitripennis]|nr:hypothetical protein J6590_003907 [Homalodisca vitripennis]
MNRRKRKNALTALNPGRHQTGDGTIQHSEKSEPETTTLPTSEVVNSKFLTICETAVS